MKSVRNIISSTISLYVLRYLMMSLCDYCKQTGISDNGNQFEVRDIDFMIGNEIVNHFLLIKISLRVSTRLEFAVF